MPLYRGDEARLLAAIALVIDEFPPIPADPTDAALLPTMALKLLGQCYDNQPLPIIATHIHQFIGHPNYAIDAESRFNYGLVRLYAAFESNSDQVFYEMLADAEAQFAGVIAIEENRSDAKLFRAVTHCFLVMSSFPMSNNVTDLVQLTQDLLRERLMAFGGAASEMRATLEYAVVALTVALDQWATRLTTVHQEPSLVPPLRELAFLYNAIREVSATDGLLGLASEIGQARIMLPALRGRFAEIQEMRAKLTALLTDPTLYESLSSAERGFYELALKELGAISDPKSAAAARLESLRAAAEHVAPAIAYQIDDFLAQNLSTIDVLLGIVQKMFEQYVADARSLTQVGGVAYDIYTALMRDVQSRLHWDEGDYHWHCLSQLLKLLSRYVDVLFSLSRQEASPTDVNFLFAKEVKGGLGQRAKEGHLEAHLYNQLRFVELFLAPTWTGMVERQNISDVPGRSDLTVRFPGNVRFVIEVKRERQDINRNAIHTNYLAQAQTYASGTEQVSFLLVLDLTPKTIGIPTPDVRDYCYVDHRPVPGAIHQNCVVVYIVPGNRYLPSMHSKGVSQTDDDTTL